MGNAPSTPAREEPPPAPEQHPRQRPGLRRRISTFIRGGNDQGNKRERSNSSQQSLAEPKRRRVTPADGIQFDQVDNLDPREPREDESMYSPPLSAGSSSGSSRAESTPQSLHTAQSHLASRASLAVPEEDSAPSPITPASPATDELLSDRLRSISTIQDTLGENLASEWTPNVPPTAAPSIMSRFRRQESVASSSSSASGPAPSGTSRFTHRLSAIMGLATPDRRPSPGRSRVPLPTPPEPSTNATTDSPAAEEEGNGIPVGAVLVIQGLAQTHAHAVEGAENDSQSPAVDIASLDQQARMIGNLLTVAAAATATTLLSPESLTAQPSRSTAQSAMQTIIERLRPSRARASQSVESALGEYLRSVLQDNRRFADAVTGETPAGANVPAEFQGFLSTLQEDLIQAVRAYAVPEATQAESEPTQTASGEAGSEVAAESSAPGAQETPEAAATAEAAPSPDTESSPAEATSEQDQAHPSPFATASATSSGDPAVPSFHPQANQNLPMANVGRGLGVSGGTDGVPRRLNFFRAHLFPTVQEDGSSASGNEDDAIVPSIFVGVRSIAHNPTLTNADLVAHPSFPFADGQVPEDAPAAPTSTPTSPPIPVITPPLSDDAHNFDRDLERELAGATPSVPPSSTRRSLRERVLDRLGGSSAPAPAAPARPSLPMNTYLIYVIGGNYPRSHPVLAIPALVSGGPLSAEDLQLVSELLGPAKPPTVTQEEINAAGLTILHGRDLAEAQSKSQVLESSVERCMVCLADYEPEDECRVLKCRHAFHTECVDQWLTTGRNSCPSCRTEAVDKASLPKREPEPEPIPGVEDADAL